MKADSLLPLAVSSVAVWLATAAPGSGAVTLGSSSGVGIDVEVSAVSLVTLDVGPLGTSSGTAPAPYSDSDSVLTVNASVVLGSVAATDDGDGALNSSASSNVDGLAGLRLATGSSTVNGLTVLLAEGVLPLSEDLLNITATTLGSTSTSSGDFGSLGAVGNSVIQDLNITVGGTALYVDLDVAPAPNTILVNAGGIVGLTIVLNEQIAGGDNVGSTSLTTNAVHVYLNGVDFNGISDITGDVVIGNSFSQLVAIPEPATATLAGLAGLMLLRRRRR